MRDRAEGHGVCCGTRPEGELPSSRRRCGCGCLRMDIRAARLGGGSVKASAGKGRFMLL